MNFALFASLGYLSSVWLLHRRKAPSKAVLSATMLVALAMHATQVSIGLQGMFNDASVMHMLSLVTVCMTIVGGWRYFSKADASAYTVVAAMAAVCVWFPVWFPLPQTYIHGWSLKFHIVLSIAAYIALGFAALYACFLLLQDARLRRGQAAFDMVLPLDYLERTMLHFTLVGELLLTLSLATGMLFINDFWSQHITHKVIFGAVAWLIIAVLMLRHYRHGFRGRKAACWLLSGFVCLLLAYFGTALVLQMLLQNGH